MDGTGRVIYVNTFSKTVAPSLRIRYAVLPPDVSRAYRERLGFLSCPVSVPEQYILAAFMTDGSLARHISRMRTRCRGVRDALLAALAASPLAERYTVSAADGGLHFPSASAHDSVGYCTVCGIGGAGGSGALSARLLCRSSCGGYAYAGHQLRRIVRRLRAGIGAPAGYCISCVVPAVDTLCPSRCTALCCRRRD